MTDFAENLQIVHNTVVGARKAKLKDLAHYRNRPFAKTVIEGKISLEVMNLVCVRLLNEALCSAMRICVVSGYI